MSFDEKSRISIEQAKEAALNILLHNAQGPFQGLPRTAGWGYPEPYTRDLMISSLGFLATGNEKLADALERTLVALANNQSPNGHIPSLAHDSANRGSSDSTPLFLFGLALYRISTNQPEFLIEEASKALHWMQYQSPDDRVMVAQLSQGTSYENEDCPDYVDVDCRSDAAADKLSRSNATKGIHSYNSGTRGRSKALSAQRQILCRH